MKKITIQKIDGYDVVINIGSAGASIDAEATKPIAKKELEKTKAWKDMEALKEQVRVYAGQAAQAKKHAKDAVTPADKRKFHDEFILRYGQMRELEKDMLPLAKELKNEFSRLMVEKAVYFNSVLPDGVSDEIVEDAEAATIEAGMNAAASEGKYYTRQGDAVPDNRGRTFWKKQGAEWHKFTPSKLGDVPPSGAVDADTLTESQLAEISEQLEKARVSALKPADRMKEKDGILSALVSRAAQMKNELEITGDSKPLEKAQKWLADERTKLEAKYA